MPLRPIQKPKLCWNFGSNCILSHTNIDPDFITAKRPYFRLQIVYQILLSGLMDAKHKFQQNEKLLSAINDARGLFMDAVEAANSGHLGMPIGCAEIDAVLFGKLLGFDPDSLTWMNRDRFILSAGHGSIFLYLWLHLAGDDISLKRIRNFAKSAA
jgi:hypothetical protein